MASTTKVTNSNKNLARESVVNTHELQQQGHSDRRTAGASSDEQQTPVKSESNKCRGETQSGNPVRNTPQSGTPLQVTNARVNGPDSSDLDFHNQSDSQEHHANTQISDNLSMHVMPGVITSLQPNLTNKLVAFSTVIACVVSVATLGITVWQLQLQKSQQEETTTSNKEFEGKERSGPVRPATTQKEKSHDQDMITPQLRLQIAIILCVGFIACLALSFLAVSLFKVLRGRGATRDGPDRHVRETRLSLIQKLSSLSTVRPSLGLVAIISIVVLVLFIRGTQENSQELPNLLADGSIKYIVGIFICLAVACSLTFAFTLSHSQHAQRRPSDRVVSAFAQIGDHSKTRAKQAHDIVRSYHVHLQAVGMEKLRFWAEPLQGEDHSKQGIEDGIDKGIGIAPSDTSVGDSDEDYMSAWEGEIKKAGDDDEGDSPKPEDFKLTDTHLTARSVLYLGEPEVTRRFHEHEKQLRRKETEQS